MGGRRWPSGAASSAWSRSPSCSSGPTRDQLRQELEDAGLAPDDVGLGAIDLLARAVRDRIA
jgi:hypothetical protein